MRRVSLKNKIFLLLVLVVVIVLIIVSIMSRTYLNTIVNDLTLDRVQTAKQGLESYLGEHATRAAQWAELIAGSERTIDAVTSGDSDNIKSIIDEYMTGIDYVNICDSDGVALFRSYDDASGDDISRYPDIAHVLETGEMSSSISLIFNGKIAACASVPMYDGNELVGIVNCFVDLTNPELLDRFKEHTGCEVTIFIGAERVNTTRYLASGVRSVGTFAEDFIVERVLDNGEVFLGIMEVDGGLHGAHYAPLISNGRTIGMLAASMDITEVLDEQREMNILTISSTLLAVVATAFFAYISSRFRLRSDRANLELAEKTASLNVAERILDMMEAQIMVTDLVDDNVVFVNRKMEEAFGLTGDTKGRKCWELFQPKYNERCDFCPKRKPEFLTGEPILWEEHNEVTVRHYRIISQMIDWPDGSKVYLQQRDDITELNDLIVGIEQAREEMRRALDTAESANRAKTTFLANMSHEIRTPMNSIIGFSELAQVDNIPLKTKEYLSNINESAEWLLNIINDVLDISKVESGKFELENIPFSLHDIFAHCRSIIVPKAEEKGLSLYCYAEPSVGKKVLGDPVRLCQVLINLLGNAVKFTYVGTVKMSASLTAYDKNSDSSKITLHFEVKDSGIGMSPEQIARIYEPFMQADDSVSRKFGGTGLGLPIAKNIIDKMGGTLKVESALGVGSKFSFDLTFGLTDEDDILNNGVVLDGLEKPIFNSEVLVCEDNPLNQRLIRDHLYRVGINAIIADNGKEGVEMVERRVKNNEKPFDLIFMDIHMPEMDGLEAASAIAAMGVKTPVIAMTANVMYNDVALYETIGLSSFLGKPYTSQELWACLMKYLPVESFEIEDKGRLSADEKKLLKRLQINFVKSNQNTSSEIEKAFDAGDIKLAHRIAHTLKGTAGQIEEMQLQEAAKAAEAMLSKGELHEKQIKILEAELKSVLENLEPLLIEADAKEIDEITDEARILELFEKLEPLLRTNNTDCMNILDEISSIPGTQELVSLIEDFKFKQALAVLARLKESGYNN